MGSQPAGYAGINQSHTAPIPKFRTFIDNFLNYHAHRKTDKRQVKQRT